MKHIISLFAIAIASAAFAASPAATQDWVRNYVATNQPVGGSIIQSVTNGTVTIIGFGADSNDWVKIETEFPDKLALVATNVQPAAASMGVTNGMMFAWNGNGEFWNAPANLFVSCVSTNCFRFNGVDSVVTNGIDTFDGYFSVKGWKITWSQSSALLPVLQAKSRSVGLIDLFVGTAYGDEWKNIDFYKPVTDQKKPAIYSYGIVDAKGEAASLLIEDDGNGGRYCSNEIEVAQKLNKSAMSTILNMSGLAAKISKQFDLIYEIDKQMEQMNEKINKTFADVFTRMNDIEKTEKSPKDNGGISYSTSNDRITGVSESKIMIASGGYRALNVDGVSIGVKNEGTEDAAYCIKGVPNSHVDFGRFPAYYGTGMTWMSLPELVDNCSIACATYPNYGNLPQFNGIGLKGWNTPTSGSGMCTHNIADLLTSGSSDGHYVLTRFSGSGSTAVHYTPLGKLNAGSALRIVGTEGAVTIGEGATTNRITFVSATDSDVRVKVTNDGVNAAKVEIGVYWK